MLFVCVEAALPGGYIHLTITFYPKGKNPEEKSSYLTPQDSPVISQCLRLFVNVDAFHFLPFLCLLLRCTSYLTEAPTNRIASWRVAVISSAGLPRFHYNADGKSHSCHCDYNSAVQVTYSDVFTVSLNIEGGFEKCV